MCGTSLAEYVGSGDRDEKFLANIFLLENKLCTSTIELPFHSIDYHALVCIYYGVGGTQSQWSTIHSAKGVRGTKPYLGEKTYRQGRLKKNMWKR